MPLNRRDLLRASAWTAGILAVGNAGALLTACGTLGGGYGPLRPDVGGLLDLPYGFSYRVLSRAGSPLADGGGLVPARFDGTGAFAASSNAVRLVRNHEIGSTGTPTVIGDPSITYDPGANGGSTTLLVGADGRLQREYVSLAGTYANCAGGITPWGTWLSCEETEARPNGQRTKDHGFVFEVDPADPTRNRSPEPLRAMGRFPHEAVCIDPRTNVAYLTEDATGPNGLLYRFVPNAAGGGYGTYRFGGRLEAMLATDGGRAIADLSVYRNAGTQLDVTWVRVADPLADRVSTRRQFMWSGDSSNAGGPVTRSRKLEGTWWGNDRAYVAASYARLSDGSAAEHDGQVWSYDPRRSKLRLELRLERNADASGAGRDKPDGPDNITVSPFGGLMMAEDGQGTNHLLSVSLDGSAHVFARNASNGSEFTGVCFAPDGGTMFANIQSPGITFAISGPFSTPH